MQQKQPPSGKILPGRADVTVAGQVINPSRRLISLGDAAEKKIIPSLSSAKMFRYRDKENFPPFHDQKGTELLYDPLELKAYYEKKRGAGHEPS